MASNEEVISTLNNLIATCRDGQQGFQTAAEAVKDGELKTLFLAYSQQRARFIAELQDEVRRFGGEAQEEGSVAGSIHRSWIDLKSAIVGRDDDSIITECERGEDSAVSNYRAALGTDLPTNVREVVERQFSLVKEAHDRIRAIGEADAAGA